MRIRAIVVMASNKLIRRITRNLDEDNYSPAGLWMGVPIFTGVPKLGVPSGFQLKDCIRGVRALPQPWPAKLLA